MAQKLTAKEEAFSQALASGKNQSDAYRAAGYSCPSNKVVNELASVLAKNPKVTKRVAELRAPAVKRAEITLESHLADLKALRDAAESASNYAAAVTAETNRGKASGLYVERLKVDMAITHEDALDALK
jgi:phage terminase small subunit